MRIDLFSLPNHLIVRIMQRTGIIIIFLLGCQNDKQVNSKNNPENNPTAGNFSGKQAYQFVLKQVAFGPRTPGSQAHSKFIDWAVGQLNDSNWDTELQLAEVRRNTITNIIARRGTGRPWIILGTHYDSRMIANRDPDPSQRRKPVLGANDGASGVAVLLELARVMPHKLDMRVDILFFDAEDNGDIPGWDWIIGSRHFVSGLDRHPDEVIILDMVGDEDLNIYQEESSDQALSSEIWKTANKLGYGDYFISQTKYNILDDHTPFLMEGIPAALIIDFDYPYWHTTSDTADKVSPKSLEIVGNTILEWVINR